MADVKISALSSAPSVADTDVIPCVVSGTTYKATALQIATATKDSTLTLTGKTINGASNTLTVRLASDVTGTLPTANQAAQSMGGDCSGTTASCTVAKVNGITCTGTPAAGAVLRATSASAAAWGQLDLADSDAVTGTLGVTNGGTGVTSLTVPATGVLVGRTDAQTLTNKTIASADNTITLDTSVFTDFGAGVATFLQTPSGANLASAMTTALPASKGGTGLTSLGSGVATMLGTFSSANIKSACTDETGAGGALVFATSPTLTTPVINGQTQGPAIAIAAMAIDWSLGNVFTKTLSAGANTFTFSNQASGMVISVRVTGAASTLTWPTVKWAGGVAPTQTASGIDVYTFIHDGTSIYGSVVQDMS